MARKNRLRNTLFVYCSAILFLGVWWCAAFLMNRPVPIAEEQSVSLEQRDSYQLHTLFPIDRDDLQSALAGNVCLMAKLIAEWDVDAKLLSRYGFKGIAHISEEKYLKAQILARQLLNNSNEELRRQHRAASVFDDSNNEIILGTLSYKFLPQTHLAATYLLSLTDPAQIVALPRGLRKTRLFPEALLKKVPLDIDRYSSERLFYQNPDIAFISNFSLPSTVEAIRNQQIRCVMINCADTLEDIPKGILKVGHIINRSLEAELSAIFFNAALLALDNQVATLQQAYQTKPRFLYLTYHAHFSMPTEKSLAGQLVKRISLQDPELAALIKAEDNKWRIPLELERIAAINPDILIISADNRTTLLKQLKEAPALAQINAMKSGRVHIVNDELMQSPSQYLILGYFDLISALSKAL